MNCPHCHKPIETKKSLRKRIEALEAELQTLRLQKTWTPVSPIWITPTPPQPEPYYPSTPWSPYIQPWGGGTNPYDQFPWGTTICAEGFAGLRAQN